MKKRAQISAYVRILERFNGKNMFAMAQKAPFTRSYYKCCQDIFHFVSAKVKAHAGKCMSSQIIQ